QNIMLANCRAVGSDKSHFSCTLSDGRSALSSIMFHCSDIEMLMHCGSVVNAAFELQIDEWHGRKSVKAIISALVPAQACCALEACLDARNLDFMADLYAVGERCACDGGFGEREEEARKDHLAKNRLFWEAQAKGNPAALEAQVVAALIGENQLHDSQAEVLDSLKRGESVLAVMPTSRGKSLIFYVHAAVAALLHHETSFFIYPLRALIADQAFHINESLEGFGITTAVLTGESTDEERGQVFAAMAKGACDIVLTTPEFFGFHIDKFMQTAKIGFVVVDEAHHIGLAKAGHRAAYRQIGAAIGRLGHPQVLALTATADSDVAEAIMATLRIDRCVCDRALRGNLEVDDQRNLKDRESYLANLVASGEKTVVYVNSREQSIGLARSLRKLPPQMASLIGFYNAGLTRLERKRIEELFRTDALCVLVATSAFGEGVNIPNIRHVVLYHLPFNEIEFNQMSGRAGRDGKPAVIHLLFGRTDAGINERILADTTPDHDCMAQIYRELRRLQKESAERSFALDNAELAELASSNKRFAVSPASAACGIAVFRELGLVETEMSYASGETRRLIHVVDTATKVELTDSIRYCEGLGEHEVFFAFRDWVMQSDEGQLKGRISKAILPSGPEH
ncbi:MAG: DEAD/DEAH box helicase, partial [Eggerthellaceae bacterium]|nr:DEAD/DEAH box helicase [Eggerthellaceae bacterium]